ncbi:MAG: hypothetical protein J6C62_06330 [Clostridia bacterium]|nr:hypothetical protein [Clostridia bacterium]
MEEKVIKQIKTSCPFPLLLYKTSVKYNEVRKASGIAYILLDLIQKTATSSEKMGEVLLKFGIPKELHYIFGKEIANLIGTEILQSVYPATHFLNPNYFSEIMVKDISLTAKGRKMFTEGAIPTGAEKTKTKDIYFSPVTRKFDVESKVAYMPLAACYLGEEFLDKVDIDISGLEDYINANTTKIGLKAEERMVSYETEEPKKLHVRKEDGMTIIIRPSGVEFFFGTSDETAFFYKYYSSALMTEGLLMKNNYKFVNALKEIVSVPTVSITELDKAVNVHLPSDVQKQATRPCKVFLNKGRLGVERSDNVIKIDDKTSGIFLDWIDENAEFALVDNSAIHYYNALNVSMPCEKFGDTFEMQLLVESIASAEQYSELVKAIFEVVKNKPFDAESGRTVLFVVDGLKDADLFGEYVEAKLSALKTADDKIELLMKMNAIFNKNAEWKAYFETFAKDLFEASVEEIRLDNMIYKTTVLSPIKEALGMTEIDYITNFTKHIANDEDSDLVYQALETAGFETNVILGVVNVIEKYMQSVIIGQNILSETSLASKFQNVKINLWKLNDMLGIESVSEYTLKDDYNVDEFFNAYSTLQTSYKGIEKYKQYAAKEYAQVKQFMDIYEPIHDILSIERTASSHPDRITKKYINDYLAHGKYKEAICDLVVKLQYDLRELLSMGDEASAHDLIEEARSQKMIDGKQASNLHKLRMCRNGFQHPERTQIPYDKVTIEAWCEDVFSLKEVEE